MTNGRGADLASLGPLAGLIGVHEGRSGIDASPGCPDPTTTGTELPITGRGLMHHTFANHLDRVG